ncbi:MAG: hypothetical protein ABSH25_00615 [Syntrophorhabdales bacterium]|jgi:hypothetical protein
MAEKLLQYYKYVANTVGIDGKVKLAQETKITSITAATTPDSPENVALFKKAIEKITGKPAPNL